MFPTLEAVKRSGAAISLSNGMNTVLQYGDLVYKEVPENHDALSKAITRVRSTIGAVLRSHIPLFSHLDYSRPLDPNLEVEITQLWRAQGIPTVEVAEEQQDAHIYKFIAGKPFNHLIERATYERSAFSALINTLHDMRAKAYAQNDVRLFHSDCHPKNFLWIEQEERAAAIDPHPRPLRTDLSLEKVDALLNLQLMYAVLAAAPENGTKYAEQFAATLTHNEKQTMLEGNIPIPTPIMAIYSTYEHAGKHIWPHKHFDLTRTHNKNALRTINDILTN